MGVSLRRTATLALVGLAVAGCARFDDTASSPFTPVPTFAPGDNGAPARPGPPAPSPAPSTSPEPLAPCQDADPAVLATCLDTTGSLTMLPGGESALVTERRTGRILRVAPGQPPVQVAQVDVDGSTDGGLLDVALSPTYGEDNLLYAYVTTASDNRVVRIAPGDTPKDVLTGIPRGQSGNSGALEFSSPGELLVLTGDAGNPAAATDPGSLAGKLLRVTALTPNPAGGQPFPTVALAGIGTAGDVCTSPHGDTVWVTDRTTLEDRLQRVPTAGAAAGVPVWTWPDRPAVAGCTAAGSAVAVSLSGGKALAVLTLDADTGAVTAAPAMLSQDRYGRLRGAAQGANNQIWVSTENKTDGPSGPTDDRVVRIDVPAGGGGFD
ncbi:PQQ-dependent sugar dehydrogenase [Rhodococcus kronopolitis]|uniref:PQQ-dependent sugar dehydrogenase n=1 Tax=Rhodococcus kronopolitis TaxID=1460226 RepID=A0ABV9FPX8_9NOCA